MLANVPEIVEPVPLAPIPVRFEVLSRVQLKVVPLTPFGFVMAIFVIAVAEHTVCVAGVALTVGTGLTIT